MHVMGYEVSLAEDIGKLKYDSFAVRLASVSVFSDLHGLAFRVFRIDGPCNHPAPIFPKPDVLGPSYQRTSNGSGTVADGPCREVEGRGLIGSQATACSRNKSFGRCQPSGTERPPR